MAPSIREAGAAFADVGSPRQEGGAPRFHALISASFREPPAPPPPAPPRVPPRPGNPFSLSRPPAPGPVAMTFRGTGPDRGRQRSPPARAGGWPTDRP